MSYQARINHPHDRATEIADHFRDRILAGDLSAGSRLPPRRELARAFGTTLPSVQKALGRLADAGFVVAEGRRGTHVVDFPPHRYHFALVLDRNITQSRYQRAVCEEAERLTAIGPEWFSIYHDIDGRAAGPGQERLLADIVARRLAGCILHMNPVFLGRNPILDAALPKVALVNDSLRSDIPAISTNRHDWLDQALGWLRERGRRQVAWLGIPNVGSAAVREFHAAARTGGFETCDGWMHAIHPLYPEWAANAMDAVFGATAAVRPDALLIADDHLAEAATAALAQLDLRIPQDLDIVCLNNFPLPLTTHAPVRQLGCDVRKTIRVCLDVLARLRTGEIIPPKLPLIAAEFAE